LNEDLRNLGPIDIFNYLQYKTRGNAYNISTLSSKVMGTVSLAGTLVVDWVYNLIVKEFKGWKDCVKGSVYYLKVEYKYYHKKDYVKEK
jgi:hypothetical protein